MRISEPAATIADQRLARVLRLLQRSEARLRHLGVLHVSVFGSTARGEATPHSDVDLMIELDRRKNSISSTSPVSAKGIRRILPFPVDYAPRTGLKAHVAPSALSDEIRVF